MRFAIAVILLGTSSGAGAAVERASLTQQGHALVAKMCASCHSIGKDDPSPHAAAPAFRNLDRRTDLDSFANRLRRGLMSGHQDMPTFRFNRDDADAVAAYVRSIQGP
jgi:mono/diheme cytochrome c family protein